MAPRIVAPDREVPGIRARSWNRPISVSYTHLDVYKRQAHPCLVPSRLRTALIILIVLVIINLCPFIVVHKNSPFTTKLIYRNFFDLLVYVREFTRDL